MPLLADDEEEMGNDSYFFSTWWGNTRNSSFSSLFRLCQESSTFYLKLKRGLWPLDVWGRWLSIIVDFKSNPLLFHPLLRGSCLLCGLSIFLRNPSLAVWLNLFMGCFLWMILEVRAKSASFSSCLICAVKILRLGITWLWPSYNYSMLLTSLRNIGLASLLPTRMEPYRDWGVCLLWLRLSTACL